MPLDLQVLKDNTFRVGLAMLAVSVLIFSSTALAESANTLDFFTVAFFLIYILFWVFLIMVFVQNKKNFGGLFRFRNSTHNILLLQLANLSAYALNYSIPVFNESTPWLIGYLAFYHIILLLWCFRPKDKMDSINNTILLTVSSGIIFHLYQSIVVLQLYPIVVISFWFFGISMLSLVPLWHLITAIRIVKKYLAVSSSYRSLLLAGLIIPLVMISLYSWRWHQVSSGMQQAVQEQTRPLHEELLPNWITLAQDLPDDNIVPRILKVKWVYQSADQLDFLSGRGMMMDEKRQHDPFVMIASFLNSELNISDEDRIHLLNSLYDQRHQTTEKLWRGDNIVTEHINTEVQLFPDYRLAYTEKTIRIRNNRKDWGGNQQEALFTFHLPEGALVSSASLWVDGKESLALLTTRGKADSAYTTIVGQERRDPLLVHWQEGNRVTARIFPVLKGEERQFKIGFTSSLSTEDDELFYQNIDFEGPFWGNAKERIEVINSGDIADLSAPWRFREEGNSWLYEGDYQSDWSLSFEAPPLSKDIFSFNGRGVQLAAINPQVQIFDPQTIYLDLHNGWNKREFKNLWEQIKDETVYVYTNRLEQMTSANHQRLFTQLQGRRYSLFPFFKIENPVAALVVSKYSGNTPVLSDLKKSSFANQLQNMAEQNTEHPVFYNLSESLSPYLRTLRDLRLFRYQSGTMEQLEEQLNKSEFIFNPEDDHTIVNHDAQLQISEIAATSQPSKAPDHLLRLYVYNKLMKQIGSHYFQKDKLEEQLVEQAAEAHIVTPISSMIVLETQADYDRFDIEKSKNSLGNASIKSSGSIPEPHEWLLIMLALSFMLWHWRAQKLG